MRVYRLTDMSAPPRLAVAAVALSILGLACADDTTPTAGTPAPTDTPTPPPLEGASCEEQTGGEEDAAMFLTEVRVAGQFGFDRVVFEFTPHEGQEAKVPFWKVAPTEPPLLEDPTGDELDVEGDAFLEAIIWASGVDLSGEEVREVYTGPESIEPPDTEVVEEVRLGGDFENVMTWFVGTTEAACFKVTELDDPVRIVLDLET